MTRVSRVIAEFICVVMASMTGLIHSDLTQRIIESFYKVYNKLGFGFLESVYVRAMLIDLEQAGLGCSRHLPISVFYNNTNVGNYFADIVVEKKVIVEVKAASALCEEHERQLINYLKATDIELGLLLNFGEKPEFRRKIFTRRNNR